MARIISKLVLVPESLEETSSTALKIEKNNRDLGHPDHIGLMRSMNRSGLLLTYAASLLDQKSLQEIKLKAQRTSIYCVNDQSAGDHEEFLRYANAEGFSTAKKFSKFVSPKWLLQSTIGLVASSLSIVLGAQGGVHSFFHPNDACWQALDLAQSDLEDGTCELAIVCAVNSLEDPLVSEWRRQQEPHRTLMEAVAILILAPGGKLQTENFLAAPSNDKIHFGIADPLVKKLRAGEI